jgi:hypothetical protein
MNFFDVHIIVAIVIYFLFSFFLMRGQGKGGVRSFEKRWGSFGTKSRRVPEKIDLKPGAL